MINLIPNEEKKKKIKDFYFRLLITLFMIVGFSMLVATLAILPAYFFSSVKKNVADEKLSLQQLDPELEVNLQISSVLKDLNTKLALVEKTEKNRYFVSDKIINEILLKKMSDIKIDYVSYRNDAPTGKIVIIRGVAPTRERLLLFRQTLEEDPLFKRVDLPISNFIKGTNIQFSLSLLPV